MADKKYFLMEMRVFYDLTDRRAQALKVLEEASELCEAAKDYVRCTENGDDCNEAFYRREMLDEFADLIQTVANFSACFEFADDEVADALERCLERNNKRGRY